jgi:hypothetical protein
MYEPSQALLDRQVHFESGGDPNAVSPKGAIGLAQIMPATGAMFGVTREQLFDPAINLWVQRQYMTYLLNRYQGDVHKAVAAYNAGPGNVDKGRIPSETQKYLGNLLGGYSSAASRLFGDARLMGEETPDDADEPEEPDDASELVKQAVKNRLAQSPPVQQQAAAQPSNILNNAIRQRMQQQSPQIDLPNNIGQIAEMVRRLRLGAVQQPRPQEATG